MGNGAAKIAEKRRKRKLELEKYPYSVGISLLKFGNELDTWCRSNCQNQWLIKWDEARFACLDDLVQFQLTWK
jgi:hypothetical protein